MIHHIFVLRDKDLVYHREYFPVFSPFEFIDLSIKIRNENPVSSDNQVLFYDFHKYKIAYRRKKFYEMHIFVVTELYDDIDDIYKVVDKIYYSFFKFIDENEIADIKGMDPSIFEFLGPKMDSITKRLKPKICLIGYPGMGKTTITKLIKEEEIPISHKPTMSGEVSSIKIGDLYFDLWDFAGQEEFSYLWGAFLKGSDAVLIITDSTLNIVERSKYFIELINEEVPYVNAMVIGNKQDLEDALKPEEIENVIGLKAYPMIAIDKGNRNKMIKIIAELLEISTEDSRLIQPLIKREKMIAEAKIAILNEDYEYAIQVFSEIINLCDDLGDLKEREWYKDLWRDAQEKQKKKEESESFPAVPLPPPPPPITIKKQMIQKININETKIIIKIYNTKDLELFITENENEMVIHKLSMVDLKIIISRITEIINNISIYPFTECIHDDPNKVPYYISFHNNIFYTGLAEEGKWIGIKAFQLENIYSILESFQTILDLMREL